MANTDNNAVSSLELNTSGAGYDSLKSGDDSLKVSASSQAWKDGDCVVAQLDIEGVIPPQERSAMKIDTPTVFYLILDTSGSMGRDCGGYGNSNRRIDISKEMAEKLAEFIFTRCTHSKITIITMDSIANVLLEPTDDIEAVKSAIRSTSCEGPTCGGTNYEEAITKAFALIEKHRANSTHFDLLNTVYSVAMLTDGGPNKGITSPSGLEMLVKSNIEDLHNTRLSVVGFGVPKDGVPEHVCRSISSAGNGSCSLVDNDDSTEVARALGGIIADATHISALNVKVVYELHDATVRPREVHATVFKKKDPTTREIVFDTIPQGSKRTVTLVAREIGSAGRANFTIEYTPSIPGNYSAEDPSEPSIRTTKHIMLSVPLAGNVEDIQPDAACYIAVGFIQNIKDEIDTARLSSIDVFEMRSLEKEWLGRFPAVRKLIRSQRSPKSREIGLVIQQLREEILSGEIWRSHTVIAATQTYSTGTGGSESQTVHQQMVAEEYTGSLYNNGSGTKPDTKTVKIEPLYESVTRTASSRSTPEKKVYSIDATYPEIKEFNHVISIRSYGDGQVLFIKDEGIEFVDEMVIPTMKVYEMSTKTNYTVCRLNGYITSINKLDRSHFRGVVGRMVKIRQTLDSRNAPNTIDFEHVVFTDNRYYYLPRVNTQKNEDRNSLLALLQSKYTNQLRVGEIADFLMALQDTQIGWDDLASMQYCEM